MNLHSILTKRNREKGPLRVGLIGAGKFGSMYLAQAGSTEGIHIAAIADMGRARHPLLRMRFHTGLPLLPTTPPP
jgi:predicted homoserine dehydrogenase-like protein